LIDSISSIAYFPELGNSELKILDLGCGGGFPSIPLAAFNPKLKIIGIDSEGTKVRCVAEAAKQIGLDNLSTIHARGRELAIKNEHKNMYDLVTVRAVATADKLIKECRQFLRPKGRILLYKTPEAIKKEEKLTLREAKKFKFDIELSPIFTLPGDAGERQFIVFHSQK
jgi:16S rRNA (guanine527-N7)-methyltransferase